MESQDIEEIESLKHCETCRRFYDCRSGYFEHLKMKSKDFPNATACKYYEREPGVEG